MKFLLHFSLCLIFLIFMFSAEGCSENKKSGVEEPTAANSAEIEHLTQEFMESINTCDLEKLMLLFADDATVFFPITEAPLRIEGRTQIWDEFKRFFDQVRSERPGPRFMNLKPEDVEIQITGKIAVVSFHIKSGIVVSRRTLVLRLDGGKWSIIHLHASNIRSEIK